MKKLLLALAAGTATLALTTGSQAQNNKAYTNQTGTGVGQTIDIDQSGSNGNVGFENSSVRQSGGGNSLVIKQSGDNNSVGRVPGSSSSSQSGQAGNNNSLRIDQVGGSQNGVTFNQNGDSNGRRAASAPPADRSPTLFGAPVDYGVYPNATWNYIQQSGGTSNATRVTQTGDNNGLIVLQADGIRNAAVLFQTSAAGTTEAGGVNLAYFSQQGGIDNTIRLIQNNTAGNTNTNRDFNSADIRQIGGTGNIVARFEGSAALPAGAARQIGSGLDLFAQQSGSYNQLSVDQQATNSRIEVVQFGASSAASDANRVNVNQTGNQQGGIFQQNGYLNIATSTQSSVPGDGPGLGNKVTTQQVGNENLIINTQFSSGYGNEAELSQFGNKNEIFNQQANGAFARISQTGSSNLASNIQEGIVGRNQVYVTQNSDNNQAYTYQQGTGDLVGSLITINQYGTGSHYASATQSSHQSTALIDQDGYLNRATTSQANGSFNSATVLQGASLNVANVAQTGFSNTATIRQNR